MKNIKFIRKTKEKQLYIVELIRLMINRTLVVL